APADARVTLNKSVIGSTTDSTAHNDVILSAARSAQSKDPCISPAVALTPAPFLPKELANQPSFFTGIDTSIEGIADLAPQLPISFRTGLRGVSYFISRASAA